MTLAEMVEPGPLELFLTWLKSGDGAGWIVGVLGLASTLWLALRRRVTRLVVREVRRISPVTLHPTIRDNINIIFRGKPVGSELGQVDVELRNTGADVVEDVRVVIAFEGRGMLGEWILDASIVDPLEGQSLSVEGASVVVQLPYLNPYRGHKAKVLVRVTAAGTIKCRRASGESAGWSVKCMPLGTTWRALLIPLLRFVFVVLASVGMLYVPARGFMGVLLWVASACIMGWAVVAALFAILDFLVAPRPTK